MKKLRGFSIIELVIYIGLMSVLLLVISRIFISSLDIQTESKAASRVEQDGRFILAHLAYSVANAESITTPSAIGDESSSLVLDEDGTLLTYSLNNNILELTENGETDRLNSPATAISGLSFQKIGNPGGNETIRVEFTITSTDTSEAAPETQTYQTTLGTR